MISGLEEVYPIDAHEINDSMFLSQPSRPRPRSQIFQRLRLSDAGERVPQD